MRNPHLSRRSLLQALTVGAGGLAFAPRSAKAQALAMPKRLIVFPIANGVSDYPDFGTPGSNATDFTLGPMLAPLESLRDQLVCLDHMEMRRSNQNVDTHFCGLTQVLTGPYPPDNGNQRSAHISLDRYAASKLSVGLPQSQLYMGTMCDSVSYSYLDDGTSVPASSNPIDVFSRVFSTLAPGGPNAALRKRLIRRQSVLDSVSKDLGEFVRRLPPEDKARAEVQLAAIQSTELNLKNLLASTGNSCVSPTLDMGLDYKSDTNVPQTLRAIVDLTVAALACDQTRVVMFHSYAREYHPPNFHCPWPPVNVPGWSFHELSHDLDGSDNFGAFKTAKAFHFQIAGELANKLNAIPEGGGTMLDHTLIFMPTEIGRGHTPAGLQFATLGGKGLGVKTGQYLIQPNTTREIGAGTPHQRLLVSILNALGIPDATFGDESGTGSGPLPGFLV